MRALLLAIALAALAALDGAWAQPLPRPALSEMRGTAADLAITTRGDVYVLDPAGGLWLQALDNRSGSWTRMPGAYAGVRATLDGSVWGLGIDGTLYRLVGSVWRAFAPDIRDVTATPDGSVLALISTGELRTLGRETQVHELAPQFANPQRVLSDQHGLPWLVYADGRLARFDGLRWTEVQPPPAGVASLGIDTEGTVMAVSRAGTAYQRNPQTAQWEEMFAGSAFLGVAVGPGGKPWFIGADRKVLASQVFSQTGAPQTRPASAFTRMLSWKRTPGRSRELSIAEDGTVLRLDPDGGIWRWNRKDNWIPMQGRFVKVAALRAGAAWVIDAQGRVFRSQANGWIEVRVAAVDVAAGPGGIVWIVQPDGRLARWDAKTTQFEPLRDASPAAAAVAVGREGEPWIIAQDGGVKRFQKGTWTDYPGLAFASLAVGPEGTVYATTAEGQLLWLDTRERQWKPATGKARKVSVGPKGAPWMIDEREEAYVSSMFTSDSDTRDSPVRTATSPSSTATAAFASPATGTSAFVGPATTGVTIMASLPPAPKRTPLNFQLLNGNFQDVGVNSSGTVFATGNDGGFYCFSNPEKKFVFATAGQARRVAVSPAGVPWVVSASGDLARFEGGGWKIVPNHRSQDVSIGSASVVISVGADLQVYRFNPAQSLFEPITSFTSGAQLQAVRAARDDASGVIWAVTPSRQLLRCERNSCVAQSILATDVGLAPDNTVFVIDANGLIQRYNAATKQFERPEGQPLGVVGVSLAVGPQGLPWLVASGGRINAAGFFGASNNLINPANCASPFLQQAQAPAPAPVAAGATISAAADTATLAPNGTLALLANDRLNGAVPTASQVSISFTTQSPSLLTQTDGVLKLSASATPGSTLTANYTICTLTGSSTSSVCASAAVTITVGQPATAGATVAGAPTIGTATAGNANASVAFTAPGSNGGSAITGYQASSSPGGFTATGSTSPITVTGLTNGTAYTFTVVAINAVGTGPASAASNSVTPVAVATAPGAPTIGTAFPGDGVALVDFTPPASDGGSAITSYTATSSPGGITGTDVTNPVLVGGLTNGVAYTFTVTATNAIGTGPASAASNSVTPLPVPTAPTFTAVVDNLDGTLTVSFAPPGAGAPFTSFDVFVTDNTPPNPPVPPASGAASPITVIGVTPSDNFTVSVTATNTSGTGPPATCTTGVNCP